MREPDRDPVGALLRPFEAGDLPALQRLRAAAFAPVFASFADLLGPDIAGLALTNADAEQAFLLEKLCAPHPDQHVIVAIGGGAVSGFVALAFDRVKRIGEISLLAVDPARQGSGLGARLCDAGLARMRAEGMQAATVGVGGDQSHAPARRAYAKAGFGKAIPSVYLYRLL